MQKIVSVAFSILVIAVFGLAQGPKTSTHIVLTAAEVKWGAAPPSLPKDVLNYVNPADDPSKANAAMK